MGKIIGEGITSVSYTHLVCEARKRQKIRYQNTKIQCNAMLHGAELSKYCRLNGEEMRLMGQAYDVLNLTARSYHLSLIHI